jgi:hypothetical protein
MINFVIAIIMMMGCVLSKQYDFSAKCENVIHSHERAHGIPRKLLKAIALIETGKKNSQGLWVPHPWTINVEGRGYFFETKEEAIKATNKFIKQGRSVDVGCMQINLKHHPHAFKDLEEAFDPWTNVGYSLSFLKKLKESQGTWEKAVSHYHSAVPSRHKPYARKVLTTWMKILNDPKDDAGINEGTAPPPMLLGENWSKKPQLIHTHQSNAAPKAPYALFARYVQMAKGNKVPVHVKMSPYKSFQPKPKFMPLGGRVSKISEGKMTAASPNVEANYQVYRLKLGNNGRHESVKFYPLS